MGHTGVWHDKKHDRWHAYINFKGRHYDFGKHSTFQLAVNARKAAEERLHDPEIEKFIEILNKKRKKEYILYKKHKS